jgi:hypothetical protein
MPLLSAAHDTALDIKPKSPAKRPKTAKLEVEGTRYISHTQRGQEVLFQPAVDTAHSCKSCARRSAASGSLFPWRPMSCSAQISSPAGI